MKVILEGLITAVFNYIKKTKKVSPLLLMLLKVTVSSRSGLSFYYYTGRCIKLKICILPFNVSSDNRLNRIHGHFMLWSSDGWNPLCSLMWQNSLTERCNFRDLLREQQDPHIACSLCAVASRHKVHFLTLLITCQWLIFVLPLSCTIPLLGRIKWMD